MRLGIITPALTMLPTAHAAWEQTATWSDVVAIAQAADRLGYDHLTCSEHVAVPAADATVRGGRYWDPLATFGYLAAATTTIRFATYVLVLGYHHPLEIAKRYGTLDQVSDGRLILGVGVGTLEAEFALLGAAFEGRGARADDALRALRASFGVARPEYHGSHFDFGDVVVEPAGVQRHVPIWIGGQSKRSLRRAVELGDAWAPFGVKADAVRDLLAAPTRTRSMWCYNRRDLSTRSATPDAPLRHCTNSSEPAQPTRRCASCITPPPTSSNSSKRPSA